MTRYHKVYIAVLLLCVAALVPITSYAQTEPFSAPAKGILNSAWGLSAILGSVILMFAFYGMAVQHGNMAVVARVLVAVGLALMAPAIVSYFQSYGGDVPAATSAGAGGRGSGTGI